MPTKCFIQLFVNVKILTIFCMVSSDWTTRGSSDLLQNRTHQLTRNMICFHSFYFIMQGKLIFLRTRCFLYQNTSQLQWFKEKKLPQSKCCCKLKSNISKVSKRGLHSVVRLQKKARRNSEHPNTKISHRLRNDKCVGFGAKLTLTADQPRAPNHIAIEFLFNGCS